MLLLCRRSESPLTVDKDNPGGLEEDQHIRQFVPIDICKFERDRSLVGVGAEKLWPQIDARVRSIPAGKFDNFDLSVKIDGKIMAGIAWGVAMPDHRIDLEGPGIAVMKIIHRIVPPVQAGSQQRP